MGSHLRKKYKQAYLNLGFLFSEGSFQAYDATKQPQRLAEITLGSPPVFLASTAFARTGKPLLVLDLRALPKRGPVAAWFGARRHVRETGAVFSGERQMTYPLVLPALFDGLIFIEKTTRARPLKK
jgi:erythromycin esterase